MKQCKNTTFFLTVHLSEVLGRVGPTLKRGVLTLSDACGSSSYSGTLLVFVDSVINSLFNSTESQTAPLAALLTSCIVCPSVAGLLLPYLPIVVYGKISMANYC